MGLVRKEKRSWWVCRRYQVPYCTNHLSSTEHPSPPLTPKNYSYLNQHHSFRHPSSWLDGITINIATVSSFTYIMIYESCVYAQCSSHPITTSPHPIKQTSHVPTALDKVEVATIYPIFSSTRSLRRETYAAQ